MLIANATTDWTTAVGTALAAVGTIGTLAWALFLFSDEQRQRRQRELIQQATLISAWAEPLSRHDEQRRAVMLRNGSDSPVYQVNVYLHPRVYAAGAQHTFGRTVMPPQANWEQSVRRDPDRTAGSTLPPVQIVFTDQRQQRWLRDSTGKLSRVDDDDWKSHFKSSQDVASSGGKYIELGH